MERVKRNSGKGGRPREDLYAKYDLDNKLIKIAAWCRDGATEREIAKKLRISISTWLKLKREFPKIKETLKTSKEEADIQVENAVFKRAVGFEFEETSQEVKVSKNGDAMPTSVKKTKKYIPSDVTAAIFWLKNRQPDKWRDRQERDVTHTLKDIKINVMSEEAKKLIESGKFFEVDPPQQG
jgi:hypothetical protein